jgi:LuxR family maltose regulon positive regulatory protein
LTLAANYCKVNVIMNELLLQTKLNPPLARQAMVDRPRLSAFFGEGLVRPEGFSRKLTLISAPAGYGKTSLAAEWLQGLQVPYAWLALEEDDNDPARFLTYLIAALGQLNEKIGSRARAMLASPQPPPYEAVLTALINDLNTQKTPLILVLDDYHHIQSEVIHRQMTFLLEHQPEHLHLLYLGREDPPLPLHRLRARRDMLEIRQDDLRFSTEEAADFFNRLYGIELSEEDIGALTQRTEGWVTGLQLAALSLRSHPDAHQFIESFTGSNRYVLDYLFEEVFQGQAVEVQSFLKSTSILNRLTPALCDAVTGGSDGRAQLQALERANLFISPLDPSRRWYRYQHLFADLLRHLLRLSAEPREAELHKRASRWYWENGHPREAVRHALAGEDWGYASRLILDSVDKMFKSGEIATVLNWYAKLPEEVIHADVGLCLNYGWALILSSQIKAAGEILRHAKQLAGEEQTTLGEIAAAEAFLAQYQGDGKQLIKKSHQALALLPEDDLDQRGIVALSLGIAYWHLGRLDEAQVALEEALPACHESDNLYGETSARIFLARTLAVRGQLHQAMVELEEIASLAEVKPIMPLVYLDLYSLHYEWNNLENASRYLKQFKKRSQLIGNLEFQLIADLGQARLELAQGDPAAAAQSVERAGQLAQTADIPARTQARYIDLIVQLALASGDLETAQKYSSQLAGNVDYHTFYRFLGLTPARLLLASGHRAEAAERLAAAAQIAKENDWGYGLIATLILQAMAADSGDTALEYLAEALRLAQPQGYIRSFADSGELLVPLLQEAAQHGNYPEYIGRILSATKGAVQTIPDQAALIEPLSRRELEVLRLLVAGLSNREIAARLVLSLGTVKTHIHNIYGKLEVSSRAQAIHRATELDLR